MPEVNPSGVMKRIVFFIGSLLSAFLPEAQGIGQRLQQAYQVFEKDAQLSYAISSLYVIDAATGQVVFDKNSRVGMAPASTQKIITSVTAMELLGSSYRYATRLSLQGNMVQDVWQGNLVISGSGDPTLGSWRWPGTKASAIFTGWKEALKKQGIRKVSGSVLVNGSRFSRQAIPDGWIWQDIGNYYGAGAYPVNWQENQFDLLLRAGDKIGDKVDLVKEEQAASYINELKTAAKGTGDNAYIYYDRLLAGTIPAGEKSFTISGADTDPASTLVRALVASLQGELAIDQRLPGQPVTTDTMAGRPLLDIAVHYSPPLDSIIYWFNKKSINLYGEALLKTIALEKEGFAATDKGAKLVRNFWKQQGLDEGELNISDGSGLSPLNRVTTHAQVEILKFAKGRSWYASFYNALPDYNGMRMKSGTISGVKGFCGYHKAASGKEYIFSFLVNNYNGQASSLVQKMYKVLDVLK